MRNNKLWGGTNKKKVLPDFLMGCNRIECKPGQETKLLKQHKISIFSFGCVAPHAERNCQPTTRMSQRLDCRNAPINVTPCVRAILRLPQSSIHVFIDYSHDIKVELDFSAQMITALKQNPPKKTINQKLWWIKFMRRNGIPCVCVCGYGKEMRRSRDIRCILDYTRSCIHLSNFGQRERERSNVFWI